ncbi:MAG: MFS transporter [Pseudomonadota bacterium]
MTSAAAEPAQSTFRARFGWALFDWAFQPFFALSAFVFAPYFASTLVGNAAEGQALWGYMLGAVGLVVALFSPLLGAMADAVGLRKPWALGFSAITVVGAVCLWLAAPEALPILAVLFIFGVANVGAEFAAVFNNAMLPSLASGRAIGRLSGIGWGMGYAGGLVALLFVLLVLVLPEAPLFGIDPSQKPAERFVGPFSAVWLVVFLIPFVVWTPDGQRSGVSVRGAVASSISRLAKTIGLARRLKNVARFLGARMLYQDGLTALLSFAGIYGAGVFGWETTTLGIFAIILIVVAVPGTVLGGFLDERFGSKRTIVFAVMGLIAGSLGALSVGPAHILFFVPVDGAESAPLTSAAELTFLAFGCLIGACVGPAQASSRTLMAHLAPREAVTEFFGLYAFSGKATAFVAPLFIALVTDATGTQRAGIAVLVVFLVLGLCLLFTVREEQADLTSGAGTG